MGGAQGGSQVRAKTPPAPTHTHTTPQPHTTPFRAAYRLLHDRIYGRVHRMFPLGAPATGAGLGIGVPEEVAVEAADGDPLRSVHLVIRTGLQGGGRVSAASQSAVLQCTERRRQHLVNNALPLVQPRHAARRTSGPHGSTRYMVHGVDGVLVTSRMRLAMQGEREMLTSRSLAS